MAIDQTIKIILDVLGGLCLVFLLLHPFGTLVWLITGRPDGKKKLRAKRPQAAYGLIITAWKSGVLVPPLVRSLIKQNFSGDWHIFVVADQCEIDSDLLSEPRVSIIYPSTALNSKTKAIDLALEQMGNKFDAAIIFDPDNLAAPDFLKTIDYYWQSGYNIIQGRRTAKNAENQIAQLDGMGEAYYNFSTRYVPSVLGGSSSVSGSGMLLAVNLYREILAHEYFHRGGVIPAEDKFIQIEALLLGHKIAFAHDAIVYDEKVSDAGQLERQRTRWLGSYFLYLPLGLKLFLNGLVRLSVHRMAFALWFLFPPVVLLAGLSGLVMIGLLFTHPSMALALFAAVLVFGLNYLFSAKQMQPTLPVEQALMKLPNFAFRMLKALLRIKETKKDFLATTNKHVVDLNDLDKPKPTA